MLNRIFLVLLFTLVLWPPAQAASQAKPLFIANVTIIDAAGNPPQHEMTVVITGDRITTLAPSARVKLPANGEVVDGRGKFLVPGLWDSHLHLTLAGKQQLTREWMAPMLIAHGVTTVRDMGGDWQRIQDLRQDIAAGRTPGPRIFTPGPFVDGPPSDTDVNTSVVTTAGQRSVEHISPVLPGDAGVMMACSGKEEMLRGEMFALDWLQTRPPTNSNCGSDSASCNGKWPKLATTRFAPTCSRFSCKTGFAPCRRRFSGNASRPSPRTICRTMMR